MTNKAILILVLSLFADAASAQNPPTKRPGMPVNVYVAPFVSPNNIDSDVLSSFRDLFEEEFGAAFSRDGVYKVLNRQIIEKIVAEAQNERDITSVDELNPKAKARLKVATADGFIFGEVTDDRDSGEVIVAVKLQSFDSVLYWDKSISIKRGLIHDHSSRKIAMEQLVNTIESVRESRRADDVRTGTPRVSGWPTVILECECGQCEHGGGGAVWVFEGWHGQAMWRYGAVADLSVEKFDGRNFTMRRVDPVGSYSSKTVPGLNGRPFTAIYTGAIDGNRHVTADVSYNCRLDGDAPDKPCNSSAACPLTSDQVLELGKNAANAGLKSAARQCFRMAASMGNSTAKVLVDEISP